MPRTRKNTDETLLTALACGATVVSAAHSSGMSPRTVHRRLKEPAFQERLQQARAEMVQRTSAMLTAAGLESVKTLLTLQQAESPAGVRLGAARSTLELGIRLREFVDLQERMIELEQKLANQSPAAGTDADAA
jgi:hypothetical protein